MPAHGGLDYKLKNNFMPIITIALLIAVALGGGTSVAANHAAPGDALYGFKVNVNENVESAFAFSDKAKADWNISKARVRLEEARGLAAKGKLDSNAQADLNANFEAHASNVAKEVRALQLQGDFAGAANIAAKFQSALAEESSEMANASAESKSNAQASLAPILLKVRATFEEASSLSADASAKAAAEGTVRAGSASGGNASSTDGTSAEANAGVDINLGY